MLQLEYKQLGPVGYTSPSDLCLKNSAQDMGSVFVHSVFLYEHRFH